MNPVPMKILRLRNSDDFSPDTPEEERSPAVDARAFEEVTQVAVETKIRVIWPEPALPGLVDRWLEKDEPEVVLLVVSSFWFTFDTVELRLRQRFGWAGRPLAGALHPVASRPWVSRQPAVRVARRAAFRTIGAAPHFTAEQVIETAEACIRRILAHEGVALAVRGPLSRFRQPSERQQHVCDARLMQVDGALGETCARRGIPYISVAPELLRPLGADYLPDGVHARPYVHARRGEAEGRALAEAWTAANTPMTN